MSRRTATQFRAGTSLRRHRGDRRAESPRLWVFAPHLGGQASPPRNQSGKYFLSAAEIRVSKTDKAVHLSEIASLGKFTALSVSHIVFHAKPPRGEKRRDWSGSPFKIAPLELFRCSADRFPPREATDAFRKRSRILRLGKLIKWDPKKSRRPASLNVAIPFSPTRNRYYAVYVSFPPARKRRRVS